MVHLKESPILCDRRCNAALDEKVNARGHIPHLNGFSPVCIPMWLRKLFRVRNDLSQCSHLNCQTPAWISKCLSRTYFWTNFWPHTWHMWCLMHWCMSRTWRFLCDRVTNFRSQNAHAYSLEIEKKRNQRSWYYGGVFFIWHILFANCRLLSVSYL